MSIDEVHKLNKRFAIEDDTLRFIRDPHGLLCAQINTPKASALISLFGGQVLSFHPVHTQHDLLYVSDQAYFDPPKAIKGGIPVCWPWFGADPENKGRPAHGFARNSFWRVVSSIEKENDEVQLVLRLCPDEKMKLVWPLQFELDLEVTISEQLQLKLTTRNLDQQVMTFTQALHTYFQIGQISQLTVNGLSGCTYIDKANDIDDNTQKGEIIFNSEVDRIYQAVPDEILIQDEQYQRSILLKSTGSKTAIVWNPWKAISAKMKDLSDDSYLHFVCVETANAADDKVVLYPGQEYTLSIRFSIDES